MDTKNNKKSPIRLSQQRIIRLKFIEEYVAAGKYPTRRKLADLLEVRPRAIKDDISYLREIGQPLEFSKEKGGFHYTKKFRPVTAPRSVTIEEIIALNFIERGCAMFKQVSYGKNAATAIGKVLASLSKDVDYPKGWKKLVSFHTSSECLFQSEIFSGLFEAGANRYQTAVLYRKPGPGNDYEERILEVLHMAVIDTEYFVFAYDAGSKKIRTFIPARMKSVKKTGKTFKARKFSIEERLKYSFKVYDGETIHDLRIEFSADVADFIREKKWGGQVDLRDLPNGGVELHLRLSSLLEVHRWLMNWCGKGLPANCPELEEMMLKAANEIIDSVKKARAERAAAKSGTAGTEASTPRIATAKAAPNNEMEKTLELIARWTPEERAEFLKRAAV